MTTGSRVAAIEHRENSVDDDERQRQRSQHLAHRFEQLFDVAARRDARTVG